ncbi:MAG TPA: hypothetical protein VIV58_10665, partial [Kofleriaceae bacterium]
MTDRLRQALAEVSAAASAFSEQMTDFDGLVQAITATCARALDASVSVALYAEDGTTITPVAVTPVRPTFEGALEGTLRHPRRHDQSLVGQLAPETGDVFVPQIELSDLRDRLTRDAQDVLAQLGVRGFISVTMR